MKKILLCTDGSAYSQVSYEYAAWLAQKIEFELEVLYVTDRRSEKAVQTQDFSGNIGIDSYQQLLQELVELEAARARVNHERAKIILDEAKTFFRDRNINRVKLTHEIGFLVDLFHLDLLLMGAYDYSRIRHLVIGSTTAQILRSSDIPVFLFR